MKSYVTLDFLKNYHKEDIKQICKENSKEFE